MEYGILVAVAEDGSFQIIGSVANRVEAQELAADYVVHGPENDYLAPYEFQIHRRSSTGGYTNIDHLTFIEAA
jgi:hypothetical protein